MIAETKERLSFYHNAIISMKIEQERKLDALHLILTSMENSEWDETFLRTAMHEWEKCLELSKISYDCMAEQKEESEVPLTNNFKLIDLIGEIMSWDIYHDFKKLQRISKIIESICTHSEIKDKTIELAKKLADFNNWKIEEELAGGEI